MKQKIEIDLEKVEEFASQGMTQQQIADALGISERTLRNRKTESADFADAIKRGQAKGIVIVTNKLMGKALSGDTTAMIFYLKARAGWKETQKLQTEVQGGDNAGMASLYAQLKIAQEK